MHAMLQRHAPLLSTTSCRADCPKATSTRPRVTAFRRKFTLLLVRSPLRLNTRIVLSSQAVASACPSGLHARPVTKSPWPCQWQVRSHQTISMQVHGHVYHQSRLHPTNCTLSVLRYSRLWDPASAAWLLCDAACFLDCLSSCLMLWPGASPPDVCLQQGTVNISWSRGLQTQITKPKCTACLAFNAIDNEPTQILLAMPLFALHAAAGVLLLVLQTFSVLASLTGADVSPLPAAVATAPAAPRTQRMRLRP